MTPAEAVSAPSPGPKRPHLTDAGKARFAAREANPCGPIQLLLRFKAVDDAYKNGDWKMLSGALEDLGAASIAWAKRVRDEKQRSYS